ncbi:MAG: glycosyltransferase [Actinobacteria bacterium]|nr:MAG: glycosyltransferase [Actinomycetota bacterium]
MPLLSVLLAAHDDATFLGEAVDSVLGQTLRDLELIVVDDASSDETPALLAAVADERLLVVRNEQQTGLAGSLNRGLDLARGRYVARLDADDVALPERLERQVERLRANNRCAVVGTAIVDVDDRGRFGATHLLPEAATALRWHALFSSPFFHPTVLVDRELLDAHELRYDPQYLESEDYELWTRLFVVADGGNLTEPLVLKRVHAGQASLRRGDLQESFQRRVALREMARVAPTLASDHAELAWRIGSGRGAVPAEAAGEAGEGLLELLGAFERRHGVDWSVRAAAARSLARAGLLGRTLKLAPWLPAQVVLERARRPVRERAVRRRMSAARRTSRDRIRVTVVSPEPTPYRAPLFDRIAALPELELTVIYAARTVASRPWTVEPQHPSVFLGGIDLPVARSVVRHDYPVTPGIFAALRGSRPHVVVVSGWSTFAAQAAVAWCRLRRVPYVLHVESHDLERRAAWRRAVKGAVVPRLVRRAASVLAVGTAARDSLLAYGARPERVRTFADTVDVPAWIERADGLARQRSDDEVVVLCVARLVPDKGVDVLVRAIAEAGDERLRLVVAGGGSEAARLAELADELGVRLTIRGDLAEDALAQEYVDADVFALLSWHEPWAVVVNEAAASGLPLVLSDRVGAARDLLREGENGFLVPAGDVFAAAAGLRRLADDPELRRALGARSRELVRGWGYEPSMEDFVAAVREAAAR